RILDKFLAIAPLRDAAEAAHPLSDIGLEPDASLFAIIYNIDAGCRLLLQHVRDAQIDVRLQRALIDRLARLLIDQHRAEGLTAWNAAGMRRQNSIGALVHQTPPLHRWCKLRRSQLGCFARRKDSNRSLPRFHREITTTQMWSPDNDLHRISADP